MAGGAQQDDEGTISSINVTPFVDIALVLLIIFMVTAKYIVTPQAIPVDLPNASSGGPITTAVSVSISPVGQLFVDARPVNEDQLRALMSQHHRQNPDVRAIIAADQSVSHGQVVHVIDLVRRSGVTKFAIQTETEGPNGSATGAQAPAPSP